MKASLLVAATAVGLVTLLSNVQAQAAFAPSGSNPFAGNDCPGDFGANFGSCKVNGSPVIIKFEYDEVNNVFKTPEINLALFPSITGSEFVFTNTGTDFDSGNWAYTPIGLDPLITAFSVKAGPNYNLYTGSGTGGSWTTPGGKDLSHIVFYDTVVPLPAALPLLGTGLLALWGLGRMRQQRLDGPVTA